MFLLDIEQLKKEEDAQQFAESAIKLLLQSRDYITELESKVNHLEELLKNAPVQEIGKSEESDNPLARKSHQMEIIEVEFKRLHDNVVMNGETLRGDDLKKFEILIKCFAALKNGDKLPKLNKKEKEMAEGELIRLVSNNYDEEQ